MADKFELTDTAPVAPDGKVNVKWQSDVDGNISAYVEMDTVHVIQDEGTPLTSRTALNFVGAGVTVTDDSANGRTVVTIPGGSQTPWTSDIDAAGHSLYAVASASAVVSHAGAGLQIREVGLAGGTPFPNLAYAPRLTFLWSGVNAVQIGMLGNADGVGVFSDTGTSYCNFHCGREFTAIGSAKTADYVSIFMFASSDASSSALQGRMDLRGSAAGTPRLAISAIEQGVAQRNVTVCESGGNVGIGTSSPEFLLDIRKNAPGAISDFITSQLAVGSSTTTKRLTLGYDTGAADAGFIQAIQHGVALKPLLLNSAGGNVAINKTSASFPLDIAGDCNLSSGSVYRINGVDIKASMQSPWVGNVNGGGFTLTNVGSITSTLKGHLFGTAGGNPTAIAQSAANIMLYNFGASNWAGFGADGNGNIWVRTGTSGTPDAAMLITPGRNVGIRNVTPAYPLDIAGDCNLSSGSVYRINGVDIKASMQSPWVGDVYGGGFSLQNVLYVVAYTLSGQIVDCQRTDAPVFRFTGTTYATDRKMAAITTTNDPTDSMSFYPMNDGYGAGSPWMTFSRSGATATKVNIKTPLNLSGLPTSASGLSSGDIWRDAAAGNVLKIVP